MHRRDIISMMVRAGSQRTPLQVYLEPRQLELLRDLAARRKEPMTHLVRESLERYLVDEIGDDDPLLGLIGLIGSGHSDTARDHDRVQTEHQLANRERSAIIPTRARRPGARRRR